VGNDARLPTQNTISKMGKFESRGGQGKKIGAAAPNPFLPTLFKNRAGAHGVLSFIEKKNFLSFIKRGN